MAQIRVHEQDEECVAPPGQCQHRQRTKFRQPCAPECSGADQCAGKKKQCQPGERFKSGIIQSEGNWRQQAEEH